MRLIDADKAITDYSKYGISHPYDAYDLEDILNECQAVEAIPMSDIKALGKEMRTTQKAITDEKVLIGFNMAVALCNKHISGKEQE